MFGSGKGSSAQVQLIVYSVRPSLGSTLTLGLILNPNPFLLSRLVVEAPSVKKTQKGYAVQRIHPFLGAEGKVGLEQEAGFLLFQGERVEFYRVRKWPFYHDFTSEFLSREPS